jgi:hypothetical protein
LANSPPAPAFPVADSIPDIPCGVSQFVCTLTCRDVIELRGPPFIRAFIAMCASGVLLSSLATGVGHVSPGEAEPPGAPVAGAHIGRGKSDPFRIPPEVGQFSHDAGGRAFE